MIWVHFAAVGLLYNATPYTLMAWGQQYIDSALAAMFIGATPLITMVLAHIFTSDDHFTPAKVAGIALGFAGLVAFLGPALVDGFQVSTWGLLAALTAAISYGAAIVYAKHDNGDVNWRPGDHAVDVAVEAGLVRPGEAVIRTRHICDFERAFLFEGFLQPFSQALAEPVSNDADLIAIGLRKRRDVAGG